MGGTTAGTQRPVCVHTAAAAAQGDHDRERADGLTHGAGAGRSARQGADDRLVADSRGDRRVSEYIGWVRSVLEWIRDTPEGRFSALAVIFSSLSTLWLTNRFADKREDRSFVRQRETEKGQFERQQLSDLQDAISEEHQIALRSGREKRELALRGVQGLVRPTTAEEAAQVGSKIKNLSARVDSPEIRGLVEKISDLHSNLLVADPDHPKRETWRVSALDTKEKLDSEIRARLFSDTTSEKQSNKPLR